MRVSMHPRNLCNWSRAAQPDPPSGRDGRWRRQVSGLIGLVLLLLCRQLNAAPGDLDSTFGIGGKVTTNFGEFRSGIANALVLQVDGKLVAATIVCPIMTALCSTQHLSLMRYNPDGMLDPTFGMGGIVTTDLGQARSLIPNTLGVQPDGKLIAAGFTQSGVSMSFALARYDPDGNLDTSFGVEGIVTTPFSLESGDTGRAYANALVVQADGKLVAAGTSIDRADFWLVRYDPDGSLDATFGTGGILTTDFGESSTDEASALVVQADGKLVAAGTTSATLSPFSAFALARYNSDGSLDPTFGVGGMVTTDFRRDSDGFHGGASALVVQPDGKLVAGGTVAGLGNDSGRASDFALVRYGPDGSLDAKFGVGGKVTTSFSTGDHVHDEFEALVSLPDGRLVGAGATEAEFGYRFALTAYNPDGSLDPLFGTGGKVVTDFASDPLLGTHNSIARALVVQADGKLVAAGFATRPLSFSPDVSLARYEGPNDSACVHDRIPPRIAKMFRRAIAFIDESVAEPSIRQKKLHRKAKSLLNAVKRAAHGATKGNRPKLSGACAAEIRSAAGTVSQSL